MKHLEEQALDCHATANLTLSDSLKEPELFLTIGSPQPRNIHSARPESSSSFDNSELASVSIEFEPNKLRALLEKRRVLQEDKVLSDTILDSKESYQLTGKRKRERATAIRTHDPVISPNSISASLSFSAGAIFVKASRIALSWKCVTPQSAYRQKKIPNRPYLSLQSRRKTCPSKERRKARRLTSMMHNNHNPRPRNRLQHSKRLDPIHSPPASSADHSASCSTSHQVVSRVTQGEKKERTIGFFFFLDQLI